MLPKRVLNVLKLQAIFRGMALRWRFTSKFVKQNAAAVKIQAIVRQRSVARLVENNQLATLKEPKLDQEEDEQEHLDEKLNVDDDELEQEQKQDQTQLDEKADDDDIDGEDDGDDALSEEDDDIDDDDEDFDDDDFDEDDFEADDDDDGSDV